MIGFKPSIEAILREVGRCKEVCAFRATRTWKTMTLPAAVARALGFEIGYERPLLELEGVGG